MKHREIEEDLRRKIASGQYSVGSMLPGRRDLARVLNTSTITVSRAIDQLIREGLLRADDRRGTFVCSPHDGPPPRYEVQLGHLRIALVTTLFLPSQDLGYGQNPWTRQVVTCLEQELAGDEHETHFVNTVQPDGTFVPLDQAVEQALASCPDGIIVAAFSNGIEEINAAQSRLVAARIPCVMISSTEIDRPVPHVFPDGFDAGYQAGQHLIKRGLRRAAYISPYRSWWAPQRGAGLLAAFEDAGFGPETVTVYPPGPVADWSLTADMGDEAFRTALPVLRDLEPDCGLVGANDDVAVAVIDAAKSLGMQVGRDYFVVGFDDTPEALVTNLTTLRIPWDLVGAESARLLRQSLISQGICSQVRVRWRLIPRGSTRGQKEATGDQKGGAPSTVS